MKHYGLPYQGSKSRIADKIMALLPPAEHFYDLFAGGCAMTHCAGLSGKYKYIHANDITDAPRLFVDAIEGKYANEDRWISREDFFRLKDTDPYVRIVWSFGNTQSSYIYSKDIEPFKKALHWAVFYRDPKPLSELGYDVTEEIYVEDTYQRWLAIKRKLAKMRGQTTHENGERKHRLRKMEDIRLQNATQLFRTQAISCPPPQITQGDYRDVEIMGDSVVYADPPYKGTHGYAPAGAFNSEAFYDWARACNFPVYISEYSMPEDFVVVGEFRRTSKFSATSAKAELERVYVHEKWADSIMRTTLF